MKGVGPRLGEATPVVVRTGTTGCAVLLRYGAAVLFGLDELEESEFLERLMPFVRHRLNDVVSDELEIIIDPDQGERMDSEGRLVLNGPDIERLQIVAEALAESVVLDHYEEKVEAAFDRLEPIAVELERHGRTGQKTRELLRHIGRTLMTQHRMVGRVEIGENPEILWDKPEFERLYVRLREEYELRERYRALEHKLELISRTAETVLELIHNKRSLRVEWYIVALIMLEIVLYLFLEFFR